MVINHATEYGSKADFVIVSLKVVEGVNRSALIKNAVGSESVIVLLENGIDIEEEIYNEFPCNELISIVAYAAITKAPPIKFITMRLVTSG